MIETLPRSTKKSARASRRLILLTPIIASAFLNAQPQPLLPFPSPYFISNIGRADLPDVLTQVAAPRMHLAIKGNFDVPGAFAAPFGQELPTEFNGVRGWVSESNYFTSTPRVWPVRILYASGEQINIEMPETLGPAGRPVIMVIAAGNAPIFGALGGFTVVAQSPGLYPVGTVIDPPSCPKDAEQCPAVSPILRLYGTGAGGEVVPATYRSGQMVGATDNFFVQTGDVKVFFDGKPMDTTVTVRVGAGNGGPDVYDVSVPEGFLSGVLGWHLVQLKVGEAFTPVTLANIQ